MATIGTINIAKGEIYTTAHKFSENRANDGYAVLTGCDVHEKTVPDMGITIDSGSVIYNGGYLSVAGGDLSIDASDPTNPRFDVIYVNAAGACLIAKGTAASILPNGETAYKRMHTPAPAASIPAGVILARIYVANGVTTILNADIDDIAMSAAQIPINILTTRGDLMYRGANYPSRLAKGSANTILAMGADDPTWITVANALAVIGNTQGQILYRDGSGWTVLSAGTSGYVLKTGGAGANPSWASVSSILAALGDTQGQIVIRDGSGWTVLSAGTAGYVLKTGGAGANPSWASIASILEAIGSTQGDLLLRKSSAWDVLAKGTANYFLKQGASEAAWAKLTTSRIWDAPAGTWNLPESNAPEVGWDAGTNGSAYVYKFDQTTEEFVESDMKVPDDIDTTGTVTFEVTGYALTAAASKYVQFKIYHSAKTSNESWDAAYATKTSGDKACNATQDRLDIHTWTETVATLTWAAGDNVRLKFSRIAPTGTNLSGDYCVLHVRIKIPTVIS